MYFQRSKIGKLFPIVFICLFLFLVLPIPSSAQNLDNGMMGNLATNAEIGGANLPTILGKIFKIILSILGLVALVIVIIAGVEWMTSGGNPEKIKKAKALLSAGLIGLLIIILSYAMVSFIVSKFSGVTNGGTGSGQGPIPLPQEQFRLTSGEANFDINKKIYLCSNIRAVFNHVINKNTVNVAVTNSTLKVVDANDDLVPGSFESAGRSILFTPENFWAKNSTYKLVVPKTISDNNSKYLVGCSNGFSPLGQCSSNGTVDWQFSTNDKSDETPPYIDHAYPVMDVDNSLYPDRNVSRAPMIDVVFNEDIDYSDIYTIEYDDDGNEIWHPNINNFQLGKINWTCRQYDGTDKETCESQLNLKGDEYCYWSGKEKCVGDEYLGIEMSENDGSETDCSIICDKNGLTGCYQKEKCAANGSLEEYAVTAENIYSNDNLIIAPISEGFRIFVANDQWLEPFTWYEIKVDGVRDMCDNPMDDSQSWVFETNNSVPAVLDWWPEGINVCPDALIGVRFATSMYENEVNVEVKNSDTGNIEFEGSIRPSDFSSGSSYEATLTTGSGSIKVIDDDDENVSNQFKIFQLDLDDMLASKNYIVTVSTDLQIDIDGNTLSKEWDFGVTNMQNCACVPLVYEVLPSQGPRQSCVTITGHCFTGTRERHAVVSELWFDDTQSSSNLELKDGPIVAIAQGITPTSLTTIIPGAYGDSSDDIPDSLGVGIKIIYDNDEEVEGSSESQFTVTSNVLANGPCIWRLAPNKGYVKDEFNIEGIKFGNTTSTDPTVKMGDEYNNLVYKHWTSVLIEDAIVPTFSTVGDRDVVVVDGNGLKSNPIPFGIIFDRPEVKEFGCNPPPAYSSPSPYKNTKDACVDIDLIVEFNKDMLDSGMDGVLNKNNYTIQNCGKGEVYNVDNCSKILYYPSEVELDSSNKMVRLSVSSVFETGTWYTVNILSNVKSKEGVELGENYTWHFKTRDTDVCPVANINLNPKDDTITGCSHTQVFIASPMASNCNALTPSSYSYDWSSSNPSVATIGIGNTWKNTITGIDGGSTWIRVEESNSLKWTKEKLNVNCCDTNKDCYDPDKDNSNRCEGSICDDTYGICTPVINSFSPESGSYNDWVTIQGCWFNNYNPAYSKVKFNDVLSTIPFDKCTSSAWQNEQIIAEVPEEGTNPFGIISLISAPYSNAFVTSTSSLVPNVFSSGDSYVGICNLRPNHGILGSTTRLTTNDNLLDQGENDAVYYSNQPAIVYPGNGWDVENYEITSQVRYDLPLGSLDTRVWQGNLYGNPLNFNIDPTGGGPGNLCIGECGDGCNVGFSYCSNPYECLEEIEGKCTNCRCCCDPDVLDSCNNTDLECLAGQGDCTGAERGLCCGCDDDDQCTNGGCGFLDSNRCCHSRPELSPAGVGTCEIGGEETTKAGLNTTFTLTFNQQMDTSRLNNEYIKISKEGKCDEGDDGEYINGRCYLNGQIVSTNNDENNTTIFYPDSCKLSAETIYAVEFVVGDNGDGVRSSQGVSYGLTGSSSCTWGNDLDCKVFAKTTASSFCLIDKVRVEPSDFTIKGRGEHDFLALALDGDGNAVCVPNFTWSSSNTDIATVSPDTGLMTTASNMDINNSIIYGETDIIAETEDWSCSSAEEHPYTCGKLKVSPTALPRVIEQQGCEICADGGQSPSPYKDSDENCSNAQIVVRFNREMDAGTLIPDNIVLTKDGSLVTIKDDDITTSYVDGETILYITGLLESLKDYQVTLKSGLEEVTGVDGIKDTNGLPLDGNKNDIQDGSPADDYIWYFETGNTDCDLNKICINPRQTVQLNHPDNENYYTDTYASNCNYLLASSFDDSYEWTFQPLITNVAEFLPSGLPLIDKWEATVQSLSLGEVEVEAKIVSSTEINDSVHLIVATNPSIDSVSPIDEALDVCRNIVITANFDQIMDNDTISPDTVKIFGKYNEAQPGLECTGCDGSTLTAPTAFENLHNKNILANLYYKLKNIFTKNVSAQIANCWCELPANISAYEEDNKTIAKIDKGLLAPDLLYKVIILGGDNGVKTQYGLGLSSDYKWTFTSGELCELSEVIINPEDIYFNTAGALENLEAHAYDDQGNEIFGVTGYDWDWQWASDNSAVVDIIGDLTEPQTEIKSQNQDGLSQITATATLNIGVPPETGASVVGQAQAQVSVCEHPWVYVDSNTGSIDTNFQFSYCRDDATPLPRLLLRGEGIVPSDCGNGIIQAGEVCDFYAGTPTHATCLFNCSGWVCDNGYYEEDGKCITIWPLAPSGLLAEIDETNPDSQINLSWNDNSVNEDEFIIERKTTGAWAEIATVGTNITSYSDTDLNKATAYYYRVKSSNAEGSSAYCSEAVATTTCPSDECFANNECHASNVCLSDTTQMCVEGDWINSCGNGFFDSECNEVCDGVVGNIPVDNTHCRDDCLNWQCDAGYGNCDRDDKNGCETNLLNTFEHCGACGNQCDLGYECSNAVCVYRSIAPSAPSELTANLNSMYPSTRIDLEWNDNSVNEDGFRIKRKDGSDGFWGEIAVVANDVVSYNDIGLTPGVSYKYNVRAYNDFGDSGYSNEVSATTEAMPSDAPNAPSEFSGSPGITQIDLNWVDNSSGIRQEDGFDLLQGFGGGWNVLERLDPNITTYTHTGLTPSTNYLYKIRAYNEHGESYSNSIEVTTNSTSGGSILE